MSGGQRIGLLVLALGVLALAFFGLSPSDTKDDTASTPNATVAQATTPDVTTTATAPAPPPAKPAAPQFETVRVRDGKPVGGIQTIKVTSGERARIEVRSQDTSDEIHLHGYDIYKDLKAGGRVRFTFDAKAEGIFEIELHGTGTQIAKLEVAPG